MIKYLRLVHFYLGVFFAPTIIFFSFSGALQTFSLHENHQGKPGIPWVTALAEVHKNQRVPETWTAKEPAADPAAKAVGTAPTQVVTSAKKLDLAEREQEAKPGGNLAKLAANPAPPKRREKSIPLKVFIAFMAIGLIVTSLLGIYMAFKYSRGPLLISGLLLAGTAVPIALLYM
jgi:hypothetical protein